MDAICFAPVGMRPSRLVALERSSADSSGLTEALESSGNVDVRLSEQHIVVWALWST